MDNLINFKELFDSWGYTKEEEEAYFKSELKKLKYVDGKLYWRPDDELDIINQIKLVSTGGSNKCGLDYDKHYVGGTNNKGYYTINLSSWKPEEYHNNQKAIIKFEGDGRSNIKTNQSLNDSIVVTQSNVLDYYGSIPKYILEGVITVIITPYKDIVNNKYYSGMAYKVKFSGLSSQVSYYDVDFFDDEIKIYIQKGRSIDIQNLMIMEYDYNYPISDLEYLYLLDSDLLYNRVANNNNVNDWEIVDVEDDVDIDDLFNGRKLLFVCYNVDELGLNEENYDKGIIDIDRIYEIRSGNTISFK